MLAMDHYMREYADDEGRILASFEMLTLTAWKPHSSQPQPAKRGSGQMGLANALK